MEQPLGTLRKHPERLFQRGSILSILQILQSSFLLLLFLLLLFLLLLFRRSASRVSPTVNRL